MWILTRPEPPGCWDMTGQPAVQHSSLAAAAGALCAVLGTRDPALAASAAAALGHAGVRAPLPLPLGGLAPCSGASQAPAVQAGAGGAAKGLGAPAGSSAGAAERTGAEAGAAAGLTSAAAANLAAASGPGGPAAAREGSGSTEAGSPADSALGSLLSATRLAAVAGMSRLMADKDPKVRRSCAWRTCMETGTLGVDYGSISASLSYHCPLHRCWAGSAATMIRV